MVNDYFDKKTIADLMKNKVWIMTIPESSVTIKMPEQAERD